MTLFSTINRGLLLSALLVSATYADTESATKTDPAAQANTTLIETAATQAATPSATEAQPASLSKAQIQQLLAQLTQRVILPLYEQAENQALAMQKQLDTFCATPNADTLKAARNSWIAALGAWQQAEVVMFGPALEKQRDLHIYFRPVKKRVIKLLLNQETPITLENLEFAGVGAQGFATLEYLLFDRDVNEAELLKRFTDDTRYCEHLKGTTSLLVRDIQAINQDWKQGYADSMIKAGSADDAVFPDAMQPLETVLGKLDQITETVPNKLSNALASGNYLAGKDPKREKVNAHKLEAWRSGHTLNNLQANITGIKILLDDGGFLAALETQGQKALATQIRSQIELVQAIDFASDDLFQQLQDKQTQAADTFYAESLKLSQLIKQLSSALGIQLGFNDSDGD